MKKTKFYSDLIDERLGAQQDLSFGKRTKKGKYGLEKFEFSVSTPEMAQRLQKEVGHYVTINCSKLFVNLKTVEDYVALNLAQSLSKFFRLASKKRKPLIMVVGLGNGGIVADSLGTKVTEKLFATLSFPKEIRRSLGKLCYLNAGVGGQTGISSFDVVKSVVQSIKPDIIVAIDALVAKNPQRLGRSFQISSSGITPGAGVGNQTCSLNKKSLKVDVLALGVPMMISGFDLCHKTDKTLADKIFTPKEVDLYIDKCSKIISTAINKAVHKSGYTSLF